MLKQIQGALENVWLAAKSEKKLKKNQITEVGLKLFFVKTVLALRQNYGKL